MTPLALTTTFVPPRSCFTDAFLYSWTSGQVAQPAAAINWIAPGRYAGALYVGLPGNSECLPPGWAASSYYSPEICPGGYTTACSSLISIGAVTETVATCCPSHYLCGWETLSTNWQTTEPCTSVFTTSGVTNVLVESGGSTITAAFPMTPGQGANAYGVQVRWQSTDTDAQPAKTSTPTAPVQTGVATSNTTAPRASSASTSQASLPSGPTTATPPPLTGLSTSAKTAIGITVPTASLAILCLFLLYRIHRPPTKATSTTTSEAETAAGDRPVVQFQGPSVELPGTVSGPHELTGWRGGLHELNVD